MLAISLAMKLSVRIAGSARTRLLGRICTMAVLVSPDWLSARAESQDGRAKRSVGMRRRDLDIVKV